MLKDIAESPLFPIANPKNIAFFGASNNVGSMGTNLLMSVMAMGFEGDIYPVHPSEEKVQGLKAYAKVGDLPVIPDLAVMVLPTRLVNETLKACGEKGLKSAIVVSGGFKEVGGEGIALEKEMVETCRQYGIRVLGPNGLGVANSHHKLNTTFVPFEGRPGFIGLASQSGSFVTQMFNYLARLSLNFSTALSVGNEANIDLVDGLEYLGACPHTKVIALYVEGIKRGREFVEVARSIVPQKPVVALYIGGSETGRKAGFSHTGSMAGPDRLYDGIFRQSGVIRARTVTELFDFCWALGSLPTLRGPRVLIQTHSGGPGAAAADACGRAGLELPSLSPETIESLKPYVPHTGSINNPIDLTFSRNPQDFFLDIPSILLKEKNADALLVYFYMLEPLIRRNLVSMGLAEDQIQSSTDQIIDEYAKIVIDMVRQQNKPLVGFTFRNLTERFSQILMKGGIPLYPEPERAARSMAAMLQYQAYRARISGQTP